MANTYTQCHVHLVFAVKHRQALIKKQWKDELEMYITGIVQNQKHKLLAISAMPDHIHIFIGYNVNQLIPDLVEEIKTSSNSWINQKGYSEHKFDWQKGYGAFTHSHNNVNQVGRYIANQEKHHRKTKFREEFADYLISNEIVYKNEYLFDFFDDFFTGE